MNFEIILSAFVVAICFYTIGRITGYARGMKDALNTFENELRENRE